ncbi:glycerol kinase [Fusarium graminearum PH-1]|uniref:glycerol kinase n=1 Tax=Gibberella zeae (strain ATCC MYA-4620 / CBS 123657 / FGSC 9075 / NRRL 31084 / PH-1) TaxID=229533 RepID=UPI00021F2583|nr:glycerol kinase [Fusarium graminearum PH-1]ESU14782.1 glycerol kinase [Fusarium graminearum PH-1]|eukprot:XP_011320207.1 glycerol kinase [Fusarium graminearum PH-1]
MQFSTTNAPHCLVQDSFDDLNPKDFFRQEFKSKRPRTADILLEELPQGLVQDAEAADLAGDFFSAKPELESDHEEQLPDGIQETEEERQKHWFVGSIDQGTTSTRFLIFNGHGEPVASHQMEFENLYPASGWHEHDPMTLLESAEICIEKATEKFCAQGHSIEEIRSIGITNQRETAVQGDNTTGEPLYNAERGLTLAREGGPIFVTDATNASRTMFMNLKTLDYDENLLKFFDVDRTKVSLPKIVPSSHPTAYGTLYKGPLKGIPIAGCLGDQSSALVGQCGFKPGQAKNTYGTGCFLLYNVGSEPVISKTGLLATVAYDFGKGRKPVYALEGSIAVAGSGIKFLENNLGLIKNSSEVDTVARTVPDNGGVTFVTAFSGLFAPYWIDDAKGTLFGVTQHTSKGHIVRATLEATCHQTAAILDAMAADSGHALDILAVDGGLSNSDLCMQTQADISGVPVDRPAMRETTALGAAIAAGLATGVWNELEELHEVNRKDRKVFYPEADPKTVRRSRRRWERAVEMSRGWLQEDEDDE